MHEAVGVPLQTQREPVVVDTQAISMSAAPQEVVFALQPPPLLVMHPETKFAHALFEVFVVGAAEQSLTTHAVPVQ